ncbi:MAG: Fe-S cluster assembly sulfur transfer protein SufU [Microbacteriaceae bacterium]
MTTDTGLYQELILEHDRERHGHGLRDGGAAESHQRNPVCGDEVLLRLHVADGRVADISWQGSGCAISMASASVLHDVVVGLSLDELGERIELFREAMRSKGRQPIDEELFGDAVALSGVSKFPARVKCALLSWMAAEHALDSVRAA